MSRRESRDVWSLEECSAFESGRKLLLHSFGLIGLAWLIFWSTGKISMFIVFLGPFASLLGCGVMIHKVRGRRHYLSMRETLWGLAGTGAGALHLYLFGAFGPTSPDRIGAIGIVVFMVGGLVILCAYSQLAKLIKGG